MTRAEVYQSIRLVKEGARAMTPALAREIAAHVRSEPGVKSWALRDQARPLIHLILEPTAEQCLSQLEQLQSERAELAPLVDGRWPEHRSPEQVQALTEVEAAIAHFERKLEILRRVAA